MRRCRMANADKWRNVELDALMDSLIRDEIVAPLAEEAESLRDVAEYREAEECERAVNDWLDLLEEWNWNGLAYKIVSQQMPLTNEDVLDEAVGNVTSAMIRQVARMARRLDALDAEGAMEQISKVFSAVVKRQTAQALRDYEPRFQEVPYEEERPQVEAIPTAGSSGMARLMDELVSYGRRRMKDREMEEFLDAWAVAATEIGPLRVNLIKQVYPELVERYADRGEKPPTERRVYRLWQKVQPFIMDFLTDELDLEVKHLSRVGSRFVVDELRGIRRLLETL